MVEPSVESGVNGLGGGAEEEHGTVKSAQPMKKSGPPAKRMSARASGDSASIGCTGPAEANLGSPRAHARRAESGTRSKA